MSKVSKFSFNILQSKTMVCCIFFAQKCGHVFYIFELKWSPAHIKTGSETSLIFGTSLRIRIGIYICEEELDLELDILDSIYVWHWKWDLKKKKYKKNRLELLLTRGQLEVNCCNLDCHSPGYLELDQNQVRYFSEPKPKLE